MDGALIRCRDLAIGRGNVPLVSGIAFEVAPGELLAVVGPNGSGKSTLLQTLLGALDPVSGCVEFPATRTRPPVALVSQADSVDPIYPFSVGEILRSARFAHARLGSIDSALEEVGLAGFQRRVFSSLSGGERQRVLLARALLSGCRLLLLDEPTSAVDFASEEQLNALVSAALSRRGLAAIVVSHRVDAIARHATRMLRLDGTARLEDAGAATSRPGVHA